jgi:hypothetical protein
MVCLTVAIFERDHIRETVLYGVVPGALFGVASSIIINYTNNKIASINLTELRTQACIVFAVHVCLVGVMATMASYILYKTHRLDLEATARAMQKNVAAVALVFCICLIPMLIMYGEVAFQSVGKEITFDDTSVSWEIVWFFFVGNHAVNIFIYATVSTKFQNTLFNILADKPAVNRKLVKLRVFRREQAPL